MKIKKNSKARVKRRGIGIPTFLLGTVDVAIILKLVRGNWNRNWNWNWNWNSAFVQIYLEDKYLRERWSISIYGSGRTWKHARGHVLTLMSTDFGAGRRPTHTHLNSTTSVSIRYFKYHPVWYCMILYLWYISRYVSMYRFSSLNRIRIRFTPFPFPFPFHSTHSDFSIPCCHVAMLPCCHAAMLPCCHTAIFSWLGRAEPIMQSDAACRICSKR